MKDEIFCESSSRLKAVQLYSQKTPFQMFDRASDYGGKFFTEYFFSKCEQICWKLRRCQDLLETFLNKKPFLYSASLSYF